MEYGHLQPVVRIERTRRENIERSSRYGRKDTGTVKGCARCERGRYCVDAKSILGIMTMDLRNQLFLTGNCEPSDRRNLVRALRARAFA